MSHRVVNRLRSHRKQENGRWSKTPNAIPTQFVCWLICSLQR